MPNKFWSTNKILTLIDDDGTEHDVKEVAMPNDELSEIIEKRYAIDGNVSFTATWTPSEQHQTGLDCIKYDGESATLDHLEFLGNEEGNPLVRLYRCPVCDGKFRFIFHGLEMRDFVPNLIWRVVKIDCNKSSYEYDIQTLTVYCTPDIYDELKIIYEVNDSKALNAFLIRTGRVAPKLNFDGSFFPVNVQKNIERHGGYFPEA